MSPLPIPRYAHFRVERDGGFAKRGDRVYAPGDTPGVVGGCLAQLAPSGELLIACWRPEFTRDGSFVRRPFWLAECYLQELRELFPLNYAAEQIMDLLVVPRRARG